MGAQLAGFEIVGGVDGDRLAVETYGNAFPRKQALKRDLTEISAKVVLRDAGISRGDIDVLVGGPPCQPYSINNHGRGTHDSRCSLVAAYLDFVSKLRPKWLVMENVPGFASIEGGSFLSALLKSLHRRSYDPSVVILDAADFGVPQRRRRLVLVASRERGAAEKVTRALSVRTAGAVSLAEALIDLPEEPGGSTTYKKGRPGKYASIMRRGAGNVVSAHLAAPLGEKNLRRITHVPQGGNWRDIPRRLLPPGMKRADRSDHTTRYGRLTWEKPAYTLLTKCDPHWGCFVHPNCDRLITVREAARIQSIPDRVSFPNSLHGSYRLIGNAVPPLLAKGILEELL